MIPTSEVTGGSLDTLLVSLARIIFAMLNNKEPFHPEMMKLAEKTTEVA